MGLFERISGAILGACIGDALGKALEDVPQDQALKHYGSKVLRFVEPHPLSPAFGLLPNETSDESAMMIALLETFATNGILDVEDYISRLSQIETSSIDPTLLRSLSILLKGKDPYQEGVISCSIFGSICGIGIGIWHYGQPLLAAQGARFLASLTHPGEQSLEAAGIMGALVSMLIGNGGKIGEKITFLRALRGFSNKKRGGFGEYLDIIEALISKRVSTKDAIELLGNSTFAFEALGMSLFLFLRFLEEPKVAVYEAVNACGEFGGDTDAIGLLTGALIGAYWGIGALEKELIESLNGWRYYISLAERIHKKIVFDGGENAV